MPSAVDTFKTFRCKLQFVQQLSPFEKNRVASISYHPLLATYNRSEASCTVVRQGVEDISDSADPRDDPEEPPPSDV